MALNLSINDRVFQFEGPVGPSGDWSATAGIATSSTTAHFGAKSLYLGGAGNWNPTILSRPMSTLGPIANSLRVWARLASGYSCQGSWCGQIAAFLSAPSVGIHDVALIPVAITGSVGTWREYMIQLPSTVVDTLSTTTYADLRVTLRINGSGPSNAVFLDDLSFGAKLGGPGADPGEPERDPLPPNEVEASFSIALPDFKPFRSALIALESLDVDAGVEVVDYDGFTGVTNLGQGLLRIGNGAKVGSVLARGNVQLGPNSRVHGDVLAQGWLDAEAGSAIDGATAVGQDVAAIRIPTRVRFPKVVQASVQLGVNQTRATPLSPGRYQSLSLAFGSEVVLVPGRYLFDSVNLEQGSRLKINDAAGAVEIYVLSTLGIRGRILREGGGQPNLLTVYFGLGTVSATGPLRGMLIAPRGTVILQSITGPVPPLEAVHRGFVLSKNIQVKGRLGICQRG